MYGYEVYVYIICIITLSLWYTGRDIREEISANNDD